MTTVQPVRDEAWSPVCAFVNLPVERGVAVLAQGTAVAVFRTFEDEVFALANHDPFSREQGLSRGIVGSRDGVPFVASPTQRQAFDLRTGRCLDDAHVRVAAYQVKVVDGIVYVGRRDPPPADRAKDRRA